MHCPFCSAIDTKVIDSRLVSEGNHVRRRRECITCEERFTTYESAELVMPRIIKQNGIREPFNEDKLFAGLNKALEKRPVSIESVEEAVNRIKANLRSTGEREIPSRTVGEQVTKELRELDEVAYVRFASVYRSFKDLAEFRAEIDKLCPKTRPERQTTETGRPESKNRRESATLPLLFQKSPMPSRCLASVGEARPWNTSETQT